MNVRPMGARLRVKVLSNERITTGGIILSPTKTAVTGEPDPAEMAKGMPPTLQACEVLDIGEGRYDPTAGRYIGSRFKIGQTLLARCGPASLVHWDQLPDRTGEFLILEDVVAGIVEAS